VGVERDAARACVDRAFDLGINFIDTANVYGRGAAESFLGEALAGRPRDSYVLATKVFGEMGPDDRGLSRAQIHKQIDASLARLRTDFVDLYQCHRYDADTPLEETMAALAEVVKAGKARWIGFSEWSPQHIADAFALDRVERFVSSQPQYSLLWRRPEQKVIPYCRDHGVSQIVWSPLAQGVLTGKYSPANKPASDTRAASESMSGAMSGWMRPEVLEAVERLKPLAAEAGCTMGQFALAWVLREENVASAIVGASRPSQLDENAAASDLVVDPALFAQAEEICAAVPRA
jgi:aryl-alcohol dehydrogenase-like predicted oxidoreductase